MIYNRSLEDTYSKSANNDNNFIPFLLGRNAINYLIKILEIRAIILPIYICPLVIDIFKNYDIKVFFYENLDRDLAIPVEEIISTLKNVHSKNKLFFLWHDYLNIIGDLPDKLSNYLKKNNIEILIDATHSLPTKKYQSQNVIYGFRKLLNQPFGSLLKSSHMEPSKHFVIINQIKLLKFLVFHKISTIIYLLFKGNNNKVINYFLKGLSKFGDRLSFDKHNFFLYDNFHYTKILDCHKNLDYENISNARSENFLRYCQSLANQINLKNFDTSCPYGYPLFIEDNKKLRNKLWQMGIHSFILWSNLHKDIPSKYLDNSNYLSNRTLILPVNQDLSPNDIERIIKIIND